MSDDGKKLIRAVTTCLSLVTKHLGLLTVCNPLSVNGLDDTTGCATDILEGIDIDIPYVITTLKQVLEVNPTFPNIRSCPIKPIIYSKGTNLIAITSLYLNGCL